VHVQHSIIMVIFYNGTYIVNNNIAFITNTHNNPNVMPVYHNDTHALAYISYTLMHIYVYIFTYGGLFDSILFIKYTLLMHS